MDLRGLAHHGTHKPTVKAVTAPSNPSRLTGRTSGEQHPIRKAPKLVELKKLLGARTLLRAPGRTTSNKKLRNKVLSLSP